MNKIDLIALDLDGTLLDPLGRVTQASKDAIAQARASGVEVFLATGRAAPEAAYFAQEAGCGVLAAALGGAVMCDARTGAHLRRWDLPRETGRRALELCLNREIVLMIFAGEAIVLDPYSKKLLMKHYPFPCFHDNAVVTEDPIAYLEEHDLPLTKLHGDGDPASYPLKELAALEGVSLTASSDRDFELVPAKVGKGRTLALMSLLRGAPGAVRRRGGQPQRPVHAGGGGNPHRHGQRQFPGEGGRPACGGGQRPRRRGRGHPVVFRAERVMLKH